MLLTFLSVRDTAYESVYHAFLLGVLGIAAKASSLEIKSNSECGEGFSDIVIKNKNIGTAVIIEFKKCDSGGLRGGAQGVSEGVTEFVSGMKYIRFLQTI